MKQARLYRHVRGDGRIPRGETKAGENLLNCIRWIDRAKYPHSRATAGAGENIQFEQADLRIVLPSLTRALRLAPFPSSSSCRGAHPSKHENGAMRRALAAGRRSDFTPRITPSPGRRPGRPAPLPLPESPPAGLLSHAGHQLSARNRGYFPAPRPLLARSSRIPFKAIPYHKYGHGTLHVAPLNGGPNRHYPRNGSHGRPLLKGNPEMPIAVPARLRAPGRATAGTSSFRAKRNHGIDA
jgi:hypothetical protein